jgi:hypothetical protein
MNAIQNFVCFAVLHPVFGIRIRRIRMFLGLLNPDPLVRGTDPDPSHFSYMCSVDQNNSCKIKFNTKFFATNGIF